ncbi:Type III restriction enzyme, res subunit family [Synechococcus sp. PCC 7335]|uniref:DEAD/DEAH box helicase n=1 Tax=Synechococcus sp. (strain ATCC 29403 / PCC 7335) TaxID=91464 RepID=UPI00017ED912|nr:DEAD/DEAH box helicase [Synechococcus sp. PCC 7335]EDX84757.1 Type III restriction enzyme, res subunit family [Synechococcus sp. PCC 7335]
MPSQLDEAQPIIAASIASGPPKLRPYQETLIKDLYKELNAGHKRVAIIAGTGAGKTVISGQICAHAEAAGKRLMFLVHLDVLVGQTYEKMKAFGLQCGFIKAGWEENRDAPIQIASIQTMAKRRWWQKWPADVVFYDEGHITLFSQVGKKVMTKTHANAVHLVMTATPLRLGKEQLGDYLETLVSSPVPNVLQEMGYLSTMKYYSMPRDSMANLEAVKTARGDYDEQDLKNACDRIELVEKIVQEWFRIGKGKRTIAFCVDIEHANHVAAEFQKAGISAETVDGNTSIKERKRLYQALKVGELMVLTSCNVISIGFDEPSVEVGLMLRPTMSSAMHFQQLGRVMRISPQTGKEYGIILDQAGNLQRLGFPEDIESYSLPTRAASSGGGGAPPTKPCPACGRIVLSFIVKCPDCAHQWISERPINTENMVEIYSNAQAQQIKDVPTLIELYHGHRRRAYKQGRGPGWADRTFMDQCGREPRAEWCFGSLYGAKPTWDEQLDIIDYLYRSARKITGDLEEWVITEFEKEVGPETWHRISCYQDRQT